jgi:hypothetical protein
MVDQGKKMGFSMSFGGQRTATPKFAPKGKANVTASKRINFGDDEDVDDEPIAEAVTGFEDNKIQQYVRISFMACLQILTIPVSVFNPNVSCFSICSAVCTKKQSRKKSSYPHYPTKISERKPQRNGPYMYLNLVSMVKRMLVLLSLRCLDNRWHSMVCKSPKRPRKRLKWTRMEALKCKLKKRRQTLLQHRHRLLKKLRWLHLFEVSIENGACTDR